MNFTLKKGLLKILISKHPMVWLIFKATRAVKWKQQFNLLKQERQNSTIFLRFREKDL